MHLPWARNRTAALWRLPGAFTGARWVSPFELRQPGACTDEATLVDAARHHSRAAAVLMSAEDPERYDFRFTDPRCPSARDCPYTVTRASRSDFLAHRYALCPTGTDVAPDLYWVIATKTSANACWTQPMPPTAGCAGRTCGVTRKTRCWNDWGCGPEGCFPSPRSACYRLHFRACHPARSDFANT